MLYCIPTLSEAGQLINEPTLPVPCYSRSAGACTGSPELRVQRTEPVGNNRMPKVLSDHESALHPMDNQRAQKLEKTSSWVDLATLGFIVVLGLVMVVGLVTASGNVTWQ